LSSKKERIQLTDTLRQVGAINAKLRRTGNSGLREAPPSLKLPLSSRLRRAGRRGRQVSEEKSDSPIKTSSKKEPQFPPRPAHIRNIAELYVAF
jgi:hypothetical protein